MQEMSFKEHEATRRSESEQAPPPRPNGCGWGTLLNVLGTIAAISGALQLILAIAEGWTAWPGAVLIGVGLQLYFFGFVADVLSDIREYLRRISDR